MVKYCQILEFTWVSPELGPSELRLNIDENWISYKLVWIIDMKSKLITEEKKLRVKKPWSCVSSKDKLSIWAKLLTKNGPISKLVDFLSFSISVFEDIDQEIIYIIISKYKFVKKKSYVREYLERKILRLYILEGF